MLIKKSKFESKIEFYSRNRKVSQKSRNFDFYFYKKFFKRKLKKGLKGMFLED